MSKTPDKDMIARKMFDEGDPDDLVIDTERSNKRVTIREEANVSLIKRRSPAQFIPLSSIVKRSSAQIRIADFDPEKYPEDKCLLESIRNRGVVTPVMVKEFLSDDDDLLADSKYELIYGHRRVSACKVLGFTTIPAFVVDTTVNADDVTMTENIGVRTLNAYERGREFHNYLESHDISIRALAEVNGFSHGYVHQVLDAYRTSRSYPEIESLYRDGKLYYRDVPALTALYGASDEPSRELLIELLPGLSQKQTTELIKVCSAGGSAAGYLKTFAKESSVQPVPVPIKQEREAKPTTAGTETNTGDDLVKIWDALREDRGYLSKHSAIYGCSQEDVKKAAEICREGNARPEMLPCMLLIRKNGGKVNEKTLESVTRASMDKNTGKAISLYISAYEKLNERKSACQKRFESLFPEESEYTGILNQLIGIKNKAGKDNKSL